jgi:imidazolonepropionase-like amidohydrolase
MKSALCGSLLAFASLAATLSSAAVPDSTVLHDVRLIDGNGGEPRPHVDVVIRGERIAAVMPATSHVATAANGAADVVNFSGKTALPGLISDHSHLGLTDGTKSGGANQTPENILRQLRQYEAYGITTVTSLGLNQQSFYDLAPKLHDGTLPGADLFGADRGFGVPEGAPPESMGILDSQVYRPRTEAEAREEVRETAARHPVLIKIWVDDFHGKMPNKLSPPMYKAIIDEAHRQGLRVAAHIFYLDDAKRLVADGVDVLAHGVRDVPVDEEFIRMMKSHHVWYIPTLGLDETFYLFAEHPELAYVPVLAHAMQPALAAQFADPAWRQKILSDTKKLASDESAAAMNLRNVKTLYDAGIRVGFGTDSGATPLRIAGFAEHRELALLVKAGLTPLQAIGTATKNAAALLGLHDRGVVEPGKLADLLVVDGDPAGSIVDIDKIEAVWHRGKRVAGKIDSFSP